MRIAEVGCCDENAEACCKVEGAHCSGGHRCGCRVGVRGNGLGQGFLAVLNVGSRSGGCVREVG